MNKIFLFICLIFLFASCKTSKHENIVYVKTMGTTGTIKFVSDIEIDFQKEIDSLLKDVNMSLSTYIENSTISKVNKKEISFSEASRKDKYFATNYLEALKVKVNTNFSFNENIKPLVDYWKVQDKNRDTYNLKIDSNLIDSLVVLINSKSQENKTLDFSALAKGFGVDVVANFLEENGLNNYMVEIGGEVHCKGTNIKNKNWKIGIEAPNEKERKLFTVVNVKNKSMATSGNYRNFKILDSGQKIVHIINPKTGYPEISNLLSASIIADDCMTADAYATACMVMGVNDAFKYVLSNEDLECYLIYSDKSGNLQTKISPGFKFHLTK